MNEIRSTQAEPVGVLEIGHADIGTLLAPAGAPRQGMRGFDPEYADIVDYIIRCTHRIWEEKAVGLIYTHYRHNSVVHTPMGTIVGRDAVVESTIKTLLAFPDRRLFGDAVVWSGDDIEGFYSSHRITNTGTNTGPTAWGPATGKRATWRGIADCHVSENRIVEEWLVRDDMHLCRQLGHDPHAAARRMAAMLTPLDVPAEPTRLPGQMAPEQARLPRDAGPEAIVAWHLDEIWNGRMLNRVRELYLPHAVVHAPTGRTLQGWNDIIGLPLMLLGAIPDAALAIQHVNSVTERARGTMVAVRWLLAGTHGGPGLFGDPTGARLRIMGISHFRLAGGRVAEEWTVFDELSTWAQIYAQTGI